ncbi:MAG: SagB/ThcOx family dehydrogenase [Fibromonadaceae bacterium]|jgi:SagB-type dehydrogenase family enzyme|nr:SagB/ThcOx family dehydrogenase [Fibromonadaceae bacterium]
MRVSPILLIAAALSFAQLSGTKVDLPKITPFDKGFSIMKSLSLRKSAASGDFLKANELSLLELSELLWAANGINRINEGKRTAPSAMNAQDIEVYVLSKNGAYLYDAQKHSLNLVSSVDLRNLAAGSQTEFGYAPIILLLVSDISKFPGKDNASKQKYGAIDAGIVSQNVSLYCSGSGLITRVRAFMEADALKKALKLNASQVPMLNHPIGK